MFNVRHKMDNGNVSGYEATRYNYVSDKNLVILNLATPIKQDDVEQSVIGLSLDAKVDVIEIFNMSGAVVDRFPGVKEAPAPKVAGRAKRARK